MALHYDYNDLKVLEELQARPSGMRRVKSERSMSEDDRSVSTSTRRPIRQASKHSRSIDSEDEDDEWPGQETPLSQRAPRGTATRERRRQQNRIAQRALRERKESHLKDLEHTNALQEQEMARLVAENAQLRAANAQIAERIRSHEAESSVSPVLSQPRSVQESPAFAAIDHRSLSLDTALASRQQGNVQQHQRRQYGSTSSLDTWPSPVLTQSPHGIRPQALDSSISPQMLHSHDRQMQHSNDDTRIWLD